MASSIKVRPARAEDGPAIVDNHVQALLAWHAFYNAFYAEDVLDVISELTIIGMNKPGTQFLVAEDDAAGVVGFVRWVNVPAKGEPGLEPQSDEVISRRNKLLAVKEHLEDLWKKFGERGDRMGEVQNDKIQGRRHISIVHLMIHPAHQRKGIGAALLSAVIAKADAEQLPSFITASREAHGLYLKLGFEDIGEGWAIDNVGWLERVIQREKELGMDVSEGEQLLLKVSAMEPEIEWVMAREPAKLQ